MLTTIFQFAKEFILRYWHLIVIGLLVNVLSSFLRNHVYLVVFVTIAIILTVFILWWAGV